MASSRGRHDERFSWQRFHDDQGANKATVEVRHLEAGSSACGQALSIYHHVPAELPARHITAQVDLPQGDEDGVPDRRDSRQAAGDAARRRVQDHGATTVGARFV